MSIGEDEEPTASVLAYNLSHIGLISESDGTFRAAFRSFGPVEQFKVDAIEDEITAAIREIAPDVLGLTLPSGRCSARGHAEDYFQNYTARSTDHGHAHTPTSRSPSSTPSPSSASASGSDPDWDDQSIPPKAIAEQLANAELNDPESDNTPTECNANLVPIHKAEQYFSDTDWMMTLSVDRRKRLTEAIKERRSKAEPLTEGDLVIADTEPDTGSIDTA